VVPTGVRLAPRLPERCAPLERPVAARDEATQAHVQVARLAYGPEGLERAEVGVHGIAHAPTHVIVHVTRADGRVASGLIDATRPRWTVPARQGAVDVLASYGELEVWHLVFG